VEEQRDGRDASDVDGVAAREDAHEELRGEVEEARRAGGGVSGEGAAVEAVEARRRERRRGGVDIARKRILHNRGKEKHNSKAAQAASLPGLVYFLSFFLSPRRCGGSPS
jgi:hypothetical protein